jgi:DNA-binding NarL/FixJ family response regulator
MITVGIAEDHHLVRDGIRALLERADDIVVVGEATNGVEAVELARTVSPDVLIMDITMPERNGIDAARMIGESASDTAVVFLSMHAELALVRRALTAGAKAYVLKGSVTEELLRAVRAAYDGAVYLSPEVASAVSVSDQELTPRESQVLVLIGDGHTNKAIASELSISVKTVERHRTAIMAKLDVGNIAELMREAFRRGLLDVGP